MSKTPEQVKEARKAITQMLTEHGVRWVDNDGSKWNIENNIDACDAIEAALVTFREQVSKEWEACVNDVTYKVSEGTTVNPGVIDILRDTMESAKKAVLHNAKEKGLLGNDK